MEDYTLTDTEFRRFRELIYRKTGIALADAKRQLVKSRLAKRLRHYSLTRYQDYYDLIVTQPDSAPEWSEFINSVTTNKTDFFREPHHFEYITQHILPTMRRKNQQGEIAPRLRVWHAGCSTGEEPYTLAMTLRETFGENSGWDVRQLASDIDTSVLAHAERGVYDVDRTGDIPKSLLHKYFLRGKGEKSHLVQVRASLREQITFRQINLLAEDWGIAPRAKFDIIFCRNVVIYFDKPTQQRLFARYAEQLRPGGYLFIGHSESLIGISDAFASVGKTIYRLPEQRESEAKAA